jgi:cell division protein ZapA
VLAALNLAYALAGRPPVRAPRATTAATSARSDGEVDVDNLITRLDEALGADGQLL